MEEPHRLGRVEHRTAADRNDEIRADALEHLDAGAYEHLVGFGCHIGEDVNVGTAQVSTQLVHHSAGLGVGVGHDDDLACSDLPEVRGSCRR